jgi:squalene-hopene/tetraprenyl-beta-curcumene cyclase
MLARAALHLAGARETQATLLQRAARYVDAQGHLAGLRARYGRDKTFAVPILTNAALAGLVPWQQVPPLPFELACLPQRWYRFARLPVVSYAIPALVAIGQARHFHAAPRFPLARWVRQLAAPASLKVLARMQPESGGYLEATPLTSFVVMSLASIGLAEHPVSRRGIRFLIDSARSDGCWPIDTNLATWTTTLAINALAADGEDVARLGCLPWLLNCQHRERHPFTGADPGGWGWSDLSGAVPDADDTPGALLALAAWRDSRSCGEAERREIREAAAIACRWLLDLQNRDGGWPTFCRGWGKLPFDRSGADLTAHALRALHAWSDLPPLRRLRKAVGRGFRYLERTQRADGTWIPLWFGNQYHPQEENPVYGTARVLLAYRDWHRLDESCARHAVDAIRQAQNADGGWGGSGGDNPGNNQAASSVEETAVAVEALAASAGAVPPDMALERGAAWLVESVESNRYLEPSPIGFYFAKLWYYERLYPRVFTLAALNRLASLNNSRTPP